MISISVRLRSLLACALVLFWGFQVLRSRGLCSVARLQDGVDWVASLDIQLPLKMTTSGFLLPLQLLLYDTVENKKDQEEEEL